MVVSARSIEDSHEINLAPFVHYVRDKETPHGRAAALSFGVGELTSQKVNVFAGVSWHFGHQSYFTIGTNWRTVQTLPFGQALNEKPIRDDVLMNLPTRTDRGYFISWTYAVVDRFRDSEE